MRYTSSELFLTAARVAVGSPDFCHRLLARLGEDLKAETASSTAEMVVYGTAIRRGDPLIDLAVAQYSPKPSHVHSCFMRTMSKAENSLQRSYKLGLRLACLRNQRTGSNAGGNPVSYLGRSGTAAFLKVASNDELLALFTNPGIDEELVEGLYRRTKPFSEVAPPKWTSMLVYCMDNPCLQKRPGGGGKADARHERIQKALWWFVDRAPFNDIFAQIILNTLARLNPDQVYLPESIEGTLERWGQSGLRKAGKTASTLTGLSRQEELRCLIASLYGKRTGALSGVSDSSRDIARRCCYYANAPLSPRQIHSGFQRDAAAFLLAAAGNADILLDREKSAALEHYLGDDWLTYRYLRIREALYRDGVGSSPDPVTHRLTAILGRGRSLELQLARDGSNTEERELQRRIADNELLVEKLDTLGKGIRSMALWILAALVAIAAVIWFK